MDHPDQLEPENAQPAAEAARVFRLLISYDGSAFHGWQEQTGFRTVQGVLNEVFRRVLRDPVTVVGASRTDAGVHAIGQVAHVVTRSVIPVERAHRAIAERLPDDVALRAVREAATSFHAIRDARRKLYRYRILAAPRAAGDPLRARYAWHVWYPLDLSALRAAAARMAGRRDFAAFASSADSRDNTVRTVQRVSVGAAEDERWVDVEGDGFLYNQVRNMVGTLIEVGRGHWQPERIDDILASRDRRNAGPTAPPHGLCLRWIRYD